MKIAVNRWIHIMTISIYRNGVSRVGCYCAISIAWDKLKAEGEVDVFRAVSTIKINRPQLVENLVRFYPTWLSIDTKIQLIARLSKQIFVLFSIRIQSLLPAYCTLLFCMLIYLPVNTQHQFDLVVTPLHRCNLKLYIFNVVCLWDCHKHQLKCSFLLYFLTLIKINGITYI